MRNARPALGVLMVLVAACLFAFNGTVAKLMLRGGFDAPQLTTLRATGAFAGLLLLCLLTPSASGRRITRLTITRRELPLLIGFGLAGFFLVPMLYFIAISRLPVGIGLLFEYMGPLFVALWARFGERQQVRPRLWVGLVLSLVGLACVAQVWSGARTLDPVGVAAGLACAVLLASYYVMGSTLVTGRDPVSVTWWAFGFSALAGAVVRPWWNFPGHLLRSTSDGVPIWLLAIYLVVFGSVFAYVLVSMAMRHLPPTSVGILGMSEPVLASIFAWALLGEVLSAPQILGGLVVLTGLVLAETARAARRPTTSQPTASRPTASRPIAGQPATLEPAPATLGPAPIGPAPVAVAVTPEIPSL
jgi:drug/metabolite transporter (DMT)-like permease